MTTDGTGATGAGDPARTVALLWRHRRPVEESRRGPRRGTSVDDIVAAATRIADRDGLDGLTMRRVAGALGVGPMTLYSYVPGRAELVDLMLDAAYLAMERPDHPDEGWRARLRATAEGNRALYAADPWAAAVSTGRPPPPPPRPRSPRSPPAPARSPPRVLLVRRTKYSDIFARHLQTLGIDVVQASRFPAPPFTEPVDPAGILDPADKVRRTRRSASPATSRWAHDLRGAYALGRSLLTPASG